MTPTKMTVSTKLKRNLMIYQNDILMIVLMLISKQMLGRALALLGVRTHIYVSFCRCFYVDFSFSVCVFLFHKCLTQISWSATAMHIYSHTHTHSETRLLCDVRECARAHTYMKYSLVVVATYSHRLKPLNPLTWNCSSIFLHVSLY